jgi:hypothetical protein
MTPLKYVIMEINNLLNRPIGTELSRHANLTSDRYLKYINNNAVSSDVLKMKFTVL